MDRKSGEGMRVGLNNRVVFDAASVSIRASQDDRDVRGILDVIIMNVPVFDSRQPSSHRTMDRRRVPL